VSYEFDPLGRDGRSLPQLEEKKKAEPIRDYIPMICSQYMRYGEQNKSLSIWVDIPCSRQFHFYFQDRGNQYFKFCQVSIVFESSAVICHEGLIMVQVFDFIFLT